MTDTDLQPRVKGLVWRTYPAGCLGAETIIGFYEIDSTGVAVYHGTGKPLFLCDEGTIDQAKAAAQTDYERRIISALAPVTRNTMTASEAMAETKKVHAETLDYLGRNIEHVTPAQAAELNPIATAPRDGTKIVVVAFDQGKFWEPTLAWWDDESDRWEYGQDYDEWEVHYWWPLPVGLRPIEEGE